MRPLIGLVVSLFLFVSFVSVVFAATNVTVIYQEPSTNAAGNLLTNLKETTIYWKQDGGLEQKITVPASNPNGGALVNRTFSVNDPPVCGSTVVTAQASASNTNATNFESVRTGSASATKNVSGDPACSTVNPPGNLTITIN